MTEELENLIKLLEEENLITDRTEGIEHLIPESISDNSNTVGENTLFICKGKNFKREYLESAVSAGVIVYISETDYRLGPRIIVSDIRKAMAVAAGWFYGFPGEKLVKVGFTGTKGKTSSTTILNEILKNCKGIRTALFTTHLTSIGPHEYESGLTTPEPVKLHSYLREAVDCGCTHVVMEVSSQAMKLNRIYGERYRVGVFLNIDDDHISPIEHADMDEYLGCKVAFFKHCDTVVINRETRFFDRVYQAAQESGCSRVILFGYDGHDANRPDAVIDHVVLTKEGLAFDLAYGGGVHRFESNLLGAFNIDNIVAASLAAMELGIPVSDIQAAVRTLFIPGRLNRFEVCGRHVFIDYAHNHLSYENLFGTVRSLYQKERIIALIGVAGDRFVRRRKDAGEVTDKYADSIIITEQDPAGRDVTELSEEVARYITKPCQIIPDREEAIMTALNMSKPGEVVILAGKGAEKSQRMAHGYEKPYKGDYAIMREWETVNTESKAK